MTGFGDTVALLSALADAADGPFHRLHAELGSMTDRTGPTVVPFAIGSTTDPSAGLAVQLSCRRRDGRLVTWQVEVWIHLRQSGLWAANVKAEIDLDDCDGDDRCVLNDQTEVTEGARVAVAVRDAARLVTGFPLDPLLAAGWEPTDWSDPSLDG